MKVLDYYDKFECIGSDCEDSCCSGWQVSIDNNTYRKYKKIEDIAVRKEVLNNIVHDKGKLTGSKYKIKLRDDASCPFLNKDKLCDIYQRCGENHLSDTCTNFPRDPRNLFSQPESALSLACPEVTRLAILPSSPIQLIDIDASTVHSKRIQTYQLKLASYSSDDFQQTYDAIRTVSFHIIQMRQISLDERLFLLGLFLDKLNDGFQENNHILMNQLIVEFIDNLEGPDEILTQYRQFKSIPHLKLEYSLTMLVTDYPASRNPRLAECLNWLNQGLGINYHEFEIDKILEKYQHADEKYYQPFLQERGYFLENYLISHLFYSGFLFSSQQSLFESYLRLITCFTNIQTTIIGMASFHQNIDTAHVLQLIQSYERFISHNANYLPSLLKKLEDLNFNSLAAMMLLLKQG
ncbi:hypothetical protein LCGC14_0867410 [marine sediment metagenome]|uniref:Lysine-N-methylase n=1 Tax=marine sediment metagenome TaxID=412755 RepID=A0A0F9P5L7_9ZZZZ|nr:hypothetical protein [Methylophaga sp.]